MLRLSYVQAAMPRMGLFFVCAVMLCACGGSAVPDSPSQDEQSLPASSATRHAKAWAELSARPGVAGSDFDPRRILVVYRPGAVLPPGWKAPSSGALSQAQQAPNALLSSEAAYTSLTAALGERYGLTVRQQVYLSGLRYASFELPDGQDAEALLKRLRSEAGSMLEAAVRSPLRKAALVPDDPDFDDPDGQQWSHWKVRCPAAWDKTQGNSSVIVAVVDTGVRLSHEELAAQVIDPQVTFPSATCDLVNNDKSVEDSHGHGSFIAGMIAAEGDNARTICGAAPLCRVLPIKVASELSATVDDLVAGALLGCQLGADVVNYSWSGPEQVPIEEQMLDALLADGCLLVCAAGNNASATDEYPTAYSAAFSVGASNKADARSAFSNYGSGVDIAAPGQDLMSCQAFADDAYEAAGQGTSFAAPLVCAAAALLWSYRPELSAAEVRSALEFSGPAASGFTRPIRRLDIAAALDSVEVPLIPTVGGLSPAADSVLGLVSGSPAAALSVSAASNVSRVQYSLDLAPIGSAGPEDLSAEAAQPPFFSAQLDLSGLTNQPAVLRADYYSQTGHHGSIESSGLSIFNQRGDADGNGAVGMSDFDLLRSLLGSQAGDGQYTIFADADMDGRITEADATAMGYYYHSGVVVPQIESVTPTEAITNTAAIFEAQLQGNGQLSFAWDFGGGALPNTSSDAQPAVTLAAAGSYNCSLEVSSEFGADSFDLVLTVTERPGPSALASADVRIGGAPLSVNFDASASASPGGSITQYQWSWDGDETFEETLGTALAQHSFPAGSHNVLLRVMDDEFASADYNLRILAGDPLALGSWQSTSLGAWGDISSFDGKRMAAAMVAGCPAVAWIWDDPNSPGEEFRVAVARRPDPQSLADWRIDLIASNDLSASIGLADINGEAAYVLGTEQQIYYGSYSGDNFANHQLISNDDRIDFATLANINGRPAVIFKSFGGGLGSGIVYAQSQLSRPLGSADWNVSPVQGPAALGGVGNYPYQLLQVGSRPVYQGRGAETGDTLTVFAGSADPGGSDWGACHFDGEVPLAEIFSHAWDQAGLPAIVYSSATASFTWELHYRLASKAQPILPGDWSDHDPMPVLSEPLTLAGSLDGRPVFGYGAATSLRLAKSGAPSSSAHWISIDCSSAGTGNRRLVSHGGLPAFFAVVGQEVHYRCPAN
ncbi:S8 family serine peptidase [bacterium]|nr:S8 family serine peptidase [bacterium]